MIARVAPRSSSPSGTPSARSYYDRYWTQSGYFPVGQSAQGVLLEIFERYAQAQDLAIDIGCGDGKAGKWLSQRANRYTGFDVSGGAVALARQSGLHAHIVDDASTLPLEDASADFAVCSEVLEHLLFPLDAVVEALRVLRPGGTLVVTVPNIAVWRNRLDFALLGRWNPGGDDQGATAPWRDPHVRFFTPRTLRAMLEAAGYDIVELRSYCSVSLLARVPAIRRFLRDGGPGPVTRALTQAWPSVFGNGVAAVARKPLGHKRALGGGG